MVHARTSSRQSVMSIKRDGNGCGLRHIATLRWEVDSAKVALEHARRKVEDYQGCQMTENRSYEQPESIRKAEASTEQISGWFAKLQAGLSDPANMQNFLDLPSWLCGQLSCEQTRRNRALTACPCNQRQISQGRDDLKRLRQRCHLDKLPCCRQEKMEEFQTMVKEIFVVVDGLYQKIRDS